MWNVVVILAVILGTVAGVLLPASRHLARTLWPGPTVKGPADVYVQAFQILFCLIGLTVVALAASLTAIIAATTIGWTAGQWLSALPVAALGAGFLAIWLLNRK